MVGRLVGWSVGWLVGWLVVYIVTRWSAVYIVKPDGWRKVSADDMMVLHEKYEREALNKKQ